MPSALLTLAVTVLLASLSWILYTLFLHPLHTIPGPKLWAMTQLPWHIANINGHLGYKLSSLHNQYGHAVRIGPNEVSFAPSSVETWKTIYAHRPEEMPKSLGGTGLLPHGKDDVADIIISSTEEHARMRKAVAPAFSEKALKSQEAYLVHYADKMVQRLHEKVAAGESTVNLGVFFNLTSFDVVGDLALGQSFGGLDSLKLDDWIGTFFGAIQAIAFGGLFVHFGLFSIMMMMLPKKQRDAQVNFWKLPQAKVDRRLEQKMGERNDFIDYFEQSEGKVGGEEGLSRKELYRNAAIMIFAGSETSATAMSGIIYYLLKNRECYEELVREIREVFKNKKDIDTSSISRLKYLNCVIQETMRVFPAAPATMPRFVPGVGERIDGYWIPGGTVVGVNQYSTGHLPLNWARTEEFWPERWLPDGERPKEFDDDSRSALQPFSYGSRNCIGQSIAIMEIKLVICRLLHDFDLDLGEGSEHWREARMYSTWEKKPLMVKLTTRA